MASIFTFDPDPPRVSSPWATPPPGESNQSLTPHQKPKPLSSNLPPNDSLGKVGKEVGIPVTDYTSITRLEAEPQEGPTEYKLHLLLRRRRSFTRSTTGSYVSGSMRRNEASLPVSVGRSVSDSSLLSSTPPPLASTQSKQHRLEQLTTQLLWRLQQSCTYHMTSSGAPVPHLSDDARLSTPEMPQRLIPGLEESKGALYEIGVADDGTIVGLAEDEMEESLNNLRAMAANLGCQVEVLRMVPVGECEWFEDAGLPQQKVHTSVLLVAEALVRPDQHLVNYTKQVLRDADGKRTDPANNDTLEPIPFNEPQAVTEQLRVSVTGATMSGKSSLLGTLSTATLDNGRGKSRLSLLRHRHEIASGMTSSVTQELIGYSDQLENDMTTTAEVISYGSRDISSWTDIHAAVDITEQGRLVFLSDSAGHPRFRRTTVRGIVGWQPHWTLLCVPADNTDDSSGKIGASPTSQEVLGPSAADVDLSQAHIQLCLDLGLPLVIVITKYDLATKAGLRQTLSRLLSALKEAGRRPCIISDPATSVLEADLHSISAHDLQEAEGVVEQLNASPLTAVPIVLTSAVKGTGIAKLHAFLRRLPVPAPLALASPETPSRLFYIEDVYSLRTNTSSDQTAVVGGYLRYGSLSIDDELILGPYPVDFSSDDSDSGSGGRVRKRSGLTSRSFPGALNAKENAPLSDSRGEWRRVRITSLRNLRLPVRTLSADQVGTVGIVPVDGPIMSPFMNRIRKGMVLAAQEPKASRVIYVRFEGTQARSTKDLSVGSAVVVYIASVRASSKVMSIAASPTMLTMQAHGRNDTHDEGGFGFGFDDEDEEGDDEGAMNAQMPVTTVGFQFIASREFVEIGARALIMPGGGPGLSGGNERGAKGLAGLEGFVGRVVDGS